MGMIPLPFHNSVPTSDRRYEGVSIYHQSHQAVLLGHHFHIPIPEEEDKGQTDTVRTLWGRRALECTQDFKLWQVPQFLRLGHLPILPFFIHKMNVITLLFWERIVETQMLKLLSRNNRD